MLIDCGPCNGTGAVGGVSCTVCGGDGQVDLTDLNFKQIRLEDRIALTGQVWSEILNKLGDLVPGDNVVTTHEVLTATDLGEYGALSDNDKASYGILISAGTLDLSEGEAGRTWLWGFFDAESTTRAALLALIA